MKLSYTIDIPEKELIFKNAMEVINDVGMSLKEKIVARTKAGIDFNGDPLHSPKDGGAPMDRTGTLIDSLTWKPSKKSPRGSIVAKGSRSNGKSKVRNAALIGILNFPSKRSDRPAMQIMNASKDDHDDARTYADKNLKAELKDTGKVKKLKIPK